MVAIVVVCNLTNFYVTQVLRHLHISHNAPFLPPKILHNLMQNFGGQIRCIMGDVQGHIKRNSKLNLMLLASNLHISHLGCMLNDQLIFNIL